MTSGRRFLVAMLGVALCEAVLAVVALPTGLGPYLLTCAALTAAAAVGGHRLMVPRGDEPGGGRARPGGGGRPPDDDRPPPWWPDFEASFGRHVAERERDRGRPRLPH